MRKKRDGVSISSSVRALPTGPDNLIARAYQLLKVRFPHLGGVHVGLTKRIPIGGGLGGGSSNAAYFLLGMNRLYRLGLTQRQLVNAGRSLGADVPFFIHNIPQAIGRGIGDQIQAVRARRRLWFLLVTSNKELSTKKVYQNLRSKPLRGAFLTKVSRAVTMLCDNLNRGSLDRIQELTHNDLEGSAFRLCPSIKNVIAKLSELGIRTARMSGSGPTVFAILSKREEAKRLHKIIKPVLTDKRLLVCHSV